MLAPGFDQWFGSENTPLRVSSRARLRRQRGADGMVLVIDSSQGILGRFLISASTNTVDIRVWEKLRPHMPEKAWSQPLDTFELT